jgi:hypothetical protein
MEQTFRTRKNCVHKMDSFFLIMMHKMDASCVSNVSNEVAPRRKSTFHTLKSLLEYFEIQRDRMSRRCFPLGLTAQTVHKSKS